jgi:predicted thioredoxin/glutaredoxin
MSTSSKDVVSYGILSTPGVLIDGKVVPTRVQVEQ